jgi:hypothetical protein
LALPIRLALIAAKRLDRDRCPRRSGALAVAYQTDDMDRADDLARVNKYLPVS